MWRKGDQALIGELPDKYAMYDGKRCVLCHYEGTVMRRNRCVYDAWLVELDEGVPLWVNQKHLFPVGYDGGRRGNWNELRDIWNPHGVTA